MTDLGVAANDGELCLAYYRKHLHEFEAWRDAVVSHFQRDPILNALNSPVIHSLKSRIKDPAHLVEKLSRKAAHGSPVAPATFFDQVTDLAGVRILHLHTRQLTAIHGKISQMVSAGDWRLGERPVAYSWDPELSGYFEGLGLRVELKESNYTSIHYLIRSPNERSPVCCEVQVRTLFEEVWGEVDHLVNYPVRAGNPNARRLLGALSRLVSSGTRLVESVIDTAASEQA